MTLSALLANKGWKKACKHGTEIRMKALLSPKFNWYVPIFDNMQLSQNALVFQFMLQELFFSKRPLITFDSGRWHNWNSLKVLTQQHWMARLCCIWLREMNRKMNHEIMMSLNKHVLVTSQSRDSWEALYRVVYPPVWTRCCNDRYNPHGNNMEIRWHFRIMGIERLTLPFLRRVISYSNTLPHDALLSTAVPLLTTVFWKPRKMQK